MDIERTRLRAQAARIASKAVPGRQPTGKEKDTYDIVQPGPQQPAQIYLPEAPTPRLGNLRLELKAAHDGFAGGTLVAASLIAAMLWFFVLAAGSLVGHETSASILLLAPGLLAAYLARPGEHRMSRTLRFPLRVLLCLDGLLMLVAATAYFALAPAKSATAGTSAGSAGAPTELVAIWIGCAILATGVALHLARSLRSGIRRRS